MPAYDEGYYDDDWEDRHNERLLDEPYYEDVNFAEYSEDYED